MYPKLEQSHRRITVRRRSPNADFLGHPPARGAPDPVFSALVERFPSYQVSKNIIELMLPAKHPDLGLFTEFAKSLGLGVGTNRANQLQIEILDYTKYSESEIHHASHLECLLHDPVVGGFLESKVSEGLGLSLDLPTFDSSGIEFGSVPNLPHLIVVRGSARRRLETAGLAGLQLLPVICRGVEHARSSADEAPAFIWSNEKLPSVNLPFFDNGGHVIKAATLADASSKSQLFILDGFEVLPALSYSHPLPDIDVSISRERIGGAEERYHRVVFSRKAGTILNDIGMRLDFTPVRIGECEVVPSHP